MKLQLITVCILIGILPIFAMSQLLLKTYERRATDQKISELAHNITIISNLLLSNGFFASAESPDINGILSEIAQVADIYEGRILIVDSGLAIRYDTYGLEEGKTLISEEAVQAVRGTNGKYLDRENQYVELTYPVINTDTKEVVGGIITSFSIVGIQDIYDNLQQAAVLMFLVLAILVCTCAILYGNFYLKPLKQMTSSFDRWSDGLMDEKIEFKGFKEMETISDSFNHMLSRLQKLEDSRQEFVSNVSHELKTPITSIKVLSDSLLSQEDVPNELYREFLVDITEEVERENKIITDLLSLVKMDKTAGEMNIASININELVEQILKRLQPIANKRSIELVFESFRPVMAEVDEVKLSLAINNLIENAIKYNFDEGWVHVSLNADHKFFYLKVADSGVGIPEDAQDSIFERFYRVDKARSRETGGTGLGLSITRNAILMHRGAIKVYSKEQEGTTFTVRIPLTYIA
ncbi:His Kinase A (phospho-acceptor) domain-containing protein [[Clostridium] polysaccharolyticum]|uniref:histidine kinase n=2 Tax=[Clostridium] polysaccharolyticum TaxID=29364 RepID=A0A1I0EJN5_9FIRM|nr:His Kinase A (phospho-acceptor) domain-containing protein [[Clostridium] polysaccharolyticum]